MRFAKPAFILLAMSALAWSGTFSKQSPKFETSFEANRGQTNPRVQFLSRGQGHTLFLTSTEAVLRTGHDVFRMRLAGANPASKAEGAEPRVAKSNYFFGSDPAKWRTGVVNYARVRFSEVYPGIDLVYYGKDGQLEYDWIVKAGADPSKIRVKFSGVKKMSLDGHGDLVIETPDGEVRERKPVIRQGREVAGHYVIRGGNEADIQIGRHDAAKPLVIDPVLEYSSYLGGSGNDHGHAIAVDSAGNAYITGHTDSTDFPTVKPVQGTNQLGNTPSVDDGDVFISKISADGKTLLYSTYLGGNGDDGGNGIAVDSAGDAFVTGYTLSSNFPTANAIQGKQLGAFGNAFVTKLNPAGNALLFSTYLGGREGDQGNGIALDAAGNAYIAGHTSSDTFPLVNPIQIPAATGGTFPSAFVTKMTADGSTIVYSTYVGGYKGEDSANGIAVDSAGNAYIAGTTSATDFPTVNALQSTIKNGSNTGFVTKINPGGSAYVYSTYLGGSIIDKVFAIAVDSSGNAYVTGWTNSTDFPTVHAVQSSGGSGSAFVSKINASGSALAYSTYLGRGGAFGYGIAVDAAGQAWVTGAMPPTNFPIVNPLMTTKDGAIFASQFSADGTSLLFSSPLWIGNELQGGIAVDSAGSAYVAGDVSPNNTSSASGFQSAFGGSQEDAFVMKVSTGPLVPSITSVVNGASFQPGVVSGSWATVLGSGLAPKIDTWDNSIVNGKLPDILDTVFVKFGVAPAYIYYISPGQINLIVPPDIGPGPVQVTVTNSAGTSAAFTVTVYSEAPAFFPWPNNQVVATRQDFTLAAKNGTFAGATTVPAKPGDVIILWGTGFGTTIPAAPQGIEIPSGVTYSTSKLPTVKIDNVSATVYGAALAPGFAGLYQVAIQVPSSLADGDWPVVVTIGGVSSGSGMVLTVQQ